MSTMSTATHSQVISLSPDNLVVYCRFDGNANDESGNGNDGMVHGAILAPDRVDNLNSAFRFDGIDDFIEVPDTASFNFSSPVTLTACMNLDDAMAGGIVGQGATAGLLTHTFYNSITDGCVRSRVRMTQMIGASAFPAWDFGVLWEYVEAWRSEAEATLTA